MDFRGIWRKSLGVGWYEGVRGLVGRPDEGRAAAGLTPGDLGTIAQSTQDHPHMTQIGAD
jgi:hypothetical protein